MSPPDLPSNPRSARDYPPEVIAKRIVATRRRVSRLGEIREIVFGAQDGLVSTFAVIATLVGAAADQVTVLVAGLAAALAGVFSMAIGEYVGSKSQAEIFESQIDAERTEVADRPFEAEAEMAYLFGREGMSEDDAWATAAILARNPDSLLATMVAKELGIPAEAEETAGTPLRGALLMGTAFALGAAVPLIAFALADTETGLAIAAAATGAFLFLMGALKSRWTRRPWWWSGSEILLFAALAGTAGYLFGTVAPSWFGFTA